MKIQIDTSPQRSPEWEAVRIGKITASMVGAVLGLAPYLTREGALRRMVRASLGAPNEFEGNIATDYGVNHESLAIVDYRMETGNDVTPCGFHHTITDGLPIGASPDGRVDIDTLIEVKCPFGLREDKDPQFKSIDDQPHYWHQMQMQMMLTGSKLTHFIQWNTHAINIQDVKADPNWWETVKHDLAMFWADYQSALDDPNEHLEPLRKVIDTAQAHMLMREYDECLEQIDRATERKAEIVQALADMAENQSAIIAGRKVTKVNKQGSISYGKAIKALLPDADLEPWRGSPSSFWKIT